MQPTIIPSIRPTTFPSSQPSSRPTFPSGQPTKIPTQQPSVQPSSAPSHETVMTLAASQVVLGVSAGTKTHPLLPPTPRFFSLSSTPLRTIFTMFTFV